jgi:hypothetical protein
MFPSSLFNRGGDELNTNCYTDDAETQHILNSTGQTLDEALNTFTESVHGALEQLGKTVVISQGEGTIVLRVARAYPACLRRRHGPQPQPDFIEQYDREVRPRHTSKGHSLTIC